MCVVCGFTGQDRLDGGILYHFGYIVVCVVVLVIDTTSNDCGLHCFIFGNISLVQAFHFGSTHIYTHTHHYAITTLSPHPQNCMSKRETNDRPTVGKSR